mgnify:CR=1 FL=1
MTNKFMNGLTAATNFTYTENGAVTHKTTVSDLLDMFALGGAYRTRSDADVINLFNKALMEDEVHALKCLFYLGLGTRQSLQQILKEFLTINLL